MNTDIFFSSIKTSLFDNAFTQSQVNGINAILNEWNKRALKDLRHLSYILSTVYHETGKTMQPVEEYGKGKDHAYGKPDPFTGQTYYGRGLVQLTFKSNYQRFTDLLNIDLVNHPERALEPEIAVEILFTGMIKGMFAGKKLSEYFSDTISDTYNARRIINITDRAQLISGYWQKFYDALKDSNT